MTDKLEPRRQNDRRDKEEPKLMASTTDKEKQLPIRTFPNIDMLEPKRVKDRKDRLDPKYAIFSNDSCDATRAIDLIETEEPKQDVSRTDTEDPTLA